LAATQAGEHRGGAQLKRREDLTTPRQQRRLGVHYDPEAFGRFSETIARTLGTARFLVFQSAFIALWIVINRLKEFDGKQLQLLTLLLSLQAAYAAPLILLAQNRQEQRDRLQSEMDRRVAERTQVDTEFLARELASVRLGLSDVASSTDLEDQLQRLGRAVERLADRFDTLEPGHPDDH
jgi:uncharacterized membrane protein